MGDLMDTTIGAVCEVYDGPHATPKKIDTGPIFLSISSLVEGRLDLTQSAHISEEDFGKWTKRVTPRKDDLVFSYETRLGDAALIPEGLRCCLGRRLALMRVKDTQILDPRFLLYYYLSAPFQNFLKERTVYGSTVNRIPLKEVPDFPLSLPRLGDQKAIAHILGTLDDKIELNQKMNRTLEEIARAIFKSWFEDFDPVRAKAEGRPTGLPPEISDLFPDELVESEIGKIPKGWDVGTLSDVADITMGQSPPGDTYNDDGVGLPFYQGSTDFGFRFPSLRKYCSEPKRLADADDVLISVRAPVGDLNRAKDDCCIGRGLASVRAKNSLQSWVFYRCKFLSQQLEMFNSEGTVFGSINGKDLKGLPTILAPEFLCKAFDEIGKPMDDAVRNRSLEIEVLTELRDILLPKLISGELRIPDAEKFIEEAGI
jgi:type I restriction enzyme S subunit